MKSVFSSVDKSSFISVEPDYKDEKIEFMIEDGKSLSTYNLPRRELFHFIGILIKIQNDFKEDSKMRDQ